VGAARPAVGSGSPPPALRYLRRALAPLAWSALVVVTVAGWWYLRAWWRSGSPTPSADADRYRAALRPPGFAADPGSFLADFAGRFTERFWGSFGWYSVRFPGWLTVALSAGAVVLVAAGFLLPRRRPRAPGRRVLAVLLVPAVLLAALTLSRAWTLHARSGQHPFIQGRYVFSGLVGLTVVAALGWVRLVPGRWSLPCLATAATVLQAGALVLAIGTYWSGGPAEQVEALAAWSGLPAVAAVSLLVAALLTLVAVPVVAVRAQPEPGADASPPVPSGSP
jgi:hypothetical protein